MIAFFYHQRENKVNSGAQSYRKWEDSPFFSVLKIVKNVLLYWNSAQKVIQMLGWYFIVSLLIADMIIKVGEEGPLLIELSYFLSDQNPEDLQSDSSVTLKSISQSDSIC